MKTVTKTIAEYKAPRCKCVKFHVQNLVCTSPGVLGAAGGDGEVNGSDDDQYDY